ncbi:aminodeoxychorismate lyase [Neobacillus sp. K501]
MYIYINGQFVKKEEAVISPFDHGFLYGIGLFETFRIYGGHPFLLDDHLERLNLGLRELEIEVNFNREVTNLILQQLLEMNQLSNAYIRFNVSAGIGEVGLQTEPYCQPNVIIFPKPLPSSGELVEKRAVLLNLKRNSPEGKERLKSHHFMNNILAKKEMGDAMDQEGIFLSPDGYVAEGIVSNIFWKKGNSLYTPSISNGILNGITRQFILKLAKEMKLDIHEGFFLPEQVEQADEVFVTNSIQEIVPLFDVWGNPKPGKNGVFVQTLFQSYREFSSTLWTRNEIIR